MCDSINVAAAVLYCLLLIAAADRPKFRLDYKYEKAFNAFYKLHQVATNWAEARIRCQAEGAELLVPDSLDEADAVPLLMTSILNRFEGIFVGIHDLYSERFFVTIKGNTMMVSILNLLWEYKQPEHSGGRCVAMRRSGRLFVRPCDKPLPFMCKAHINQIYYYAECHTFEPRWKAGINDTCYFMHLEPQTWHQAYATCLAAGGHLAIINDQQEADYIKSLFKQTQTRRIPDNDFAFLGFNDLFTRYHYRTVHGERVEDLGYKDWVQMNCPQQNMTDDDYRCGGIRRTGLLATWSCNVPAMFFCEKPANNSMVKSILRSAEPPRTTPTTTMRRTRRLTKDEKMSQHEELEAFS